MYKLHYAVVQEKIVIDNYVKENDDDSSDARPSFAEAMLLQPAPDSAAYKLLHPSLDEALEKNPSAKGEIAKSSQDNLATIADNTAPAPEMPVPPPFAPPSVMVGVGARHKASSTTTATTQQDTLMEPDVPTAPEVPARPPVPAPRAAKVKVIDFPLMVEETGLTIWSDMMLKGHPGCHATNWEQ